VVRAANKTSARRVLARMRSPTHRTRQQQVEECSQRRHRTNAYASRASPVTRTVLGEEGKQAKTRYSRHRPLKELNVEPPHPEGRQRVAVRPANGPTGPVFDVGVNRELAIVAQRAATERHKLR